LDGEGKFAQPYVNGSDEMTFCAVLQNWGFSEKIGPVYLSDGEGSLSASKREEIETEVRR
jgi:hypothetical protein